MLKNSMATTAQIFYDLNKHFCSVEDQKVLYEGAGGTTNRTMNGSQMDVEPGSSVSLPDSTQILEVITARCLEIYVHIAMKFLTVEFR